MQAIDAAMARSRTVILGLVIIFVAGIYAYMTIPKEAEPDIEIPVIYVQITHEGISPEDAERLLVRPMEQEIRSVEGIKEMIAQAYEGGANVQVEFEAGVDTDKALQDIRERVDNAAAKLPSETEDPTITEGKMTRFDPMLVLNLAGNVPERALTKIAKAEEFLHGLGIRQLRVRHHDTVARIEVGVEDFAILTDEPVRTKVTDFLRSIGYSYETLDLEGFRSGSLNEVLAALAKKRATEA